MNTKTTALALILLTVVATAVSVLILSMQPAVKADTTNAVASDAESSSTPLAVNANDSFGGFYGGPMAFGMGPGFGMGHRGGLGGFGGFGGLQVSSDFTANVTNIANSDSDVQNLLNQGYNITSIRPVISTTVDGNGNIVTKASTADLTLLGNNGSRAFVVVDLTQAKVTKIVTIAVTEIDM